jgi:hypothetical protein
VLRRPVDVSLIQISPPLFYAQRYFVLFVVIFAKDLLLAVWAFCEEKISLLNFYSFYPILSSNLMHIVLIFTHAKEGDSWTSCLSASRLCSLLQAGFL